MNESVHSRTPESIREAILTRGAYNFKETILIIVNVSSNIVMSSISGWKIMILFLNEKTHVRSETSILVTLLMIDKKFFENFSPILIDSF